MLKGREIHLLVTINTEGQLQTRTSSPAIQGAAVQANTEEAAPALQALQGSTGAVVETQEDRTAAVAHPARRDHLTEEGSFAK